MRELYGRAVVLFILAGLLAVDAASVEAQQPAPAGRIAVTGHGAGLAVNDMATLTIGAIARETEAAGAFARAGAAAGQVLAAVEAAGVAQIDVTTQSLSLTPIYGREGGRLADVEAYEAGQRLEVRLRDVKAVGPLIDRLATIPDAVVEGVRFSPADPGAATDAARAAAVQDAFRIAAQIAEEAGVTLGRPVSIEEGVSRMPEGALMRATMDSMPVASGGSAVSVSLSVVFAMTP